MSGRPYIVGIGATSDTHELANNLLYGGALQHMFNQDWYNFHMPWMVALQDANANAYPHGMYSLGLKTTAQFTQSQGDGLVLQPATTDMLAGVYLATGMNDTRAAAVPTAKKVKAWGLENFYTKTETYSKTEADGLLALKVDKADFSTYKDSVNAQLQAHNQTVARQLSAQDTYIRNQLFTKAEFNTAKQEFITKTRDLEGWEVMPESRYNELANINAKVIYILTAEE